MGTNYEHLRAEERAVGPSSSLTLIALAAQHRFRRVAERGGLISYGPDGGDQFRRAAGYVDRILKGPGAGAKDIP
jgi:hypothetical protein